VAQLEIKTLPSRTQLLIKARANKRGIWLGQISLIAASLIAQRWRTDK
jgi:hypothetical protein